MAESNKDKPTLIIDSNVWDMTWILNKTARLVEKYEVPITITIDKSNSVEVQIIFGLVGGAFGGEMARLFARDIYFYAKEKLIKQRTGKKPPQIKSPQKKMDMMISRDQGARKKVQRLKKEIEIRWNDRWEEEGLPTGEEDER